MVLKAGGDVEWGRLVPLSAGSPPPAKHAFISISCIIQQARFEHCYLSSTASQNWVHSSICLANICLTSMSSRMNKAESLLDVNLVDASLERRNSFLA